MGIENQTFKLKQPTEHNGRRMLFDSTAPGCPDAPVDNGDLGEQHMEESEQHMEEYSDEDKIEMRNANIAFLLTAAAAATSSALDLFLYKWQGKVTGTDADGEDEDQVIAFSSEYTMMTAEEVTTPYWRYASLIMDWTCFTVMSTLTVTQLLSMLGIAASTNLMAWHYGGMVAGLMTLVAYIMSFLGHKAGWDVAKEDAEDDVIDGNGAAGLAYAQDI